jgi:hypothetical protein
MLMQTALNQISVDIVVYNERLAIILGFVTLAFLLATLFSCRSFLSFLNRLSVKNPTENRVYRSFYKYHSFYWWGLVFSLILHLIVGVMHILYFDPADPDAYLHTYIYIAGGAAFIVTLVVYTSCRSYAGLLTLITGKNPLSGKVFTILYRYHNYYWMILIVIVILHFTFSYMHTGVWVN